MVKKVIILLSMLLWMPLGALGGDFSTSTEVDSRSICLILFDLAQNKIVEKYHPAQCAKRHTPASTFKIPLSLMAFDQHLINSETLFKWDGIPKGNPLWNQDQTPSTWLAYSTFWVSQVLTPQLGMNTIQSYLKKFQYGNRDFSGDLGKNNGLKHAWLSSSLKISANEQFQFLKSLITFQLPISHEAMEITKANLFLETSPQGYRLYGKTGTGLEANGSHEIGWFMGFLETPATTYVVVFNFSAPVHPEQSEPAGVRSKAMTKSILQTRGLW